MAIGIHNMGASIKFAGHDGLRLVLKSSIKTISIIRHETIRIDVNDTHKAIAFRYTEVTDPVTNSAHDLAYLINDMITECVCCNCSSDNAQDR